MMRIGKKYIWIAFWPAYAALAVWAVWWLWPKIELAYEAIVAVLGPTGTFVVGGFAVYVIISGIIEEWRQRWRWELKAWWDQ